MQMKRLKMNHASWLRATVAIAFAACALAALAGCASPKVEVEQSQVQSDFEGDRGILGFRWRFGAKPLR